MDINGFREPQSPWFFTQPPTYLTEIQVNRVVAPKRNTDPTPDSRFPGWSAPMEDGRAQTDYRPKCAVNFAAGTQFAGRRFMQHNAEQIIQQSRNRQAEKNGAGMSYDSITEVPAQMYVYCSPDQCDYQMNMSKGVGVERSESVPPLFGTFATSRPSLLTPAQPTLTRMYEGGRNSVRGVF